MRHTWAEVDLGAIADNVSAIEALAAPARVCAVVKADGYGHGAAEVARTAIAAGARSLGVALVEEGAHLRAAGVDAPILLLSEPPSDDYDEILELGLRPAVYSAAGVEAAVAALARRPDLAPMRAHLKIDTGMHRVGADPADVVALAQRVVALEPQGLRLEGLFTHCAVADEPANAFTGEQLQRFEHARAALAAVGISPRWVHAANSAAALVLPEARLALVRCGIAIYGIEPAPGVNGGIELRPALSLHSRVSFVKTVAAGEAVSYGLRYRLSRPTRIATVPIGYADGVIRALGATGGEVLVGGRRRPIAGTVTMDQLTIDCGDDPVEVGDEVVLLGVQGDERITAADWGRLTDTIGYEVVCGISSRVPRRYVGP